jgi:hypothetical protein
MHFSIGYPTDLKSLNCDGLIAVKLNPVVQYKYIPTNLFTVLPSPRGSQSITL